MFWQHHQLYQFKYIQDFISDLKKKHIVLRRYSICLNIKTSFYFTLMTEFSFHTMEEFI